MADVNTDTTPQVPGTVNIGQQPVLGTTPIPAPGPIAAPVPKNVNGGPATFSNVTDSVADLINSNVAKINADRDAAVKNANVDTAAAQSISTLTNSSLENLQNIQKITALPGGADGDIATIFGLFDHRYNYSYQKTGIDINQMKASQISSTAAAIKEQNNILPTLAAGQAAGAKVIFDAQKDVNLLAQGQQTLDLKSMEVKLSARRLAIEQGDAAIRQSKFRVDNLTTAQAEAILPQAQAGKGAFAGLGGLIEDRLTSEKLAVANAGKAQVEYQKGNREEGNASLVDMVSHFPHDATAAAIAQAESTKSPVVNFPVGKNPDGSQKMLPVPYDLAQQGLVKSLATSNQVDVALAADYSSKMNILPNVTNIMKSAGAFASSDPRATQIMGNLGSMMQQMNKVDPQTNQDGWKNPAAVRQFGMQVEKFKEQTTQMAKDTAAQYDTKTAQAAVEKFGTNGTFDMVGGTAVVGASVGIPSYTKNSRYPNMWLGLNRQVADELARQKFIPFGTAQNNADAQSMLAAALAKPNGRERISQITQEQLTDPTKTKPLMNSIKNTIQDVAIKSTFRQLAVAQGANPVFAQILNNPDQFKAPKLGADGKPEVDANGKPTGAMVVSPAKMFEAMEKAALTTSVNSKQHVDYSAMFLQGLLTYGATADSQNTSDPNYGIGDHAAEASMFGGNPVGNIVGDTHYTLRSIAAQVRQQMEKRINDDVSGQTQREAVQRTNGDLAADAVLANPNGSEAKKFFNTTGIDINTVPSATGTGLTAAQVKAYRSGMH